MNFMQARYQDQYQFNGKIRSFPCTHVHMVDILLIISSICKQVQNQNIFFDADSSWYLQGGEIVREQGILRSISFQGVCLVEAHFCISPSICHRLVEVQWGVLLPRLMKLAADDRSLLIRNKYDTLCDSASFSILFVSLTLLLELGHFSHYLTNDIWKW